MKSYSLFFLLLKSPFHLIPRCVLLAAMLLIVSGEAMGQAPPPAWGHTQYFQYNIENIVVTSTATPETWNVKVIFSVTDPTTIGNDPWNIKSAAPFLPANGGRLTIDMGWDPSTDFTNAGSRGSLAPVVTPPSSTGAAYPIQVNALTLSTACLDFAQCPGAVSLTNRFWVSRSVTPIAFMQPVVVGRVAIEGRPVCASPLAGCPAGPPFAAVPVQSMFRDFSFTAIPAVADARREIVDINKCKVCHDGNLHSDEDDATPIPRLSLHGGGRNENLGVCVICHNPNQTDIPWRTAGNEVSVDFKRMVHAIHAGGMRKNPLVIIGFQGSVNDFSHVRFPAKLRNCLNCHIEIDGKGTFELPLPSTVLGTTVNTGSVQATLTTPRIVDVNPFNDLKITPIAAACSGCHDESKVQSHMISTGGASFTTLQQNIGTTVKEHCPNCHGPEKEVDVRKVHDLAKDEEEKED